MKNSNQLTALVVVMFFGFIISSCSQQKQRDFNPELTSRTILLEVNTAQIQPPNSQIDRYCSFPDQSSNEPDSAFTTFVSRGDTIIWRGASISPPYTDGVAITQINHHGKKNLLKNVTLGQNGIVIGIIKDEGVEIGDEEKYTIHFRVTKPGSPAQPYHIDPKLQILN